MEVHVEIKNERCGYGLSGRSCSVFLVFSIAFFGNPSGLGFLSITGSREIGKLDRMANLIFRFLTPSLCGILMTPNPVPSFLKTFGW